MIDLRSDTVTLPTEEMMDAMRRAELADDSRDGDPTVLRLETAAASATGKEAAVLLASGTMANLVALLAHTGRGGEVLADAGSHILRSELGGIAHIAGLFHRAVPADRGALDTAALRELLSAHLAVNRLATALVCVETTHNDGGGAVVPLACMAQVRAVTAEKGVPVHIDGARLFNAAIALGLPANEISRYGDSVAVSICKGLSAPVGSILCGTATFIERARAFRRMVGGGMRQAGIIAAAGIVALEQMVERLADDHRRAALLAHGLHDINPRWVDPRLVETNIVRVSLDETGADTKFWSSALSAYGVRVGIWNATSLRLVIHRHISDADIEQTISAFYAVHQQGTAERKRFAVTG